MPELFRLLPAVDLPQGFVENDAGARGQVQAADVAGWHRDADRAARVSRSQGVRQSLGFRAEQQAIAIAKLRLRVRNRCRAFDEPDVEVFLQEILIYKTRMIFLARFIQRYTVTR